MHGAGAGSAGRMLLGPKRMSKKQKSTNFNSRLAIGISSYIPRTERFHKCAHGIGDHRLPQNRLGRVSSHHFGLEPSLPIKNLVMWVMAPNRDETSGYVGRWLSDSYHVGHPTRVWKRNPPDLVVAQWRTAFDDI